MKTLFLSLLFMLPVMVQAYDVKVDGIYYNLDKASKTATVTKGDVNYETNELESYKGNVTIPEHVKVDGVTYVVDKVDEWAFYANRNLTAITFPNTMKTIGESAFFECSGLKQVVIPNSVEYIAEYAFHSCSGLTSVTIGSGVKDIAPYSFGYCENVTKLIYAEGCTQAVNTGLTTLTSVSIPNSVTCIADSAFYDNMSLTSITIPESVTSIGDYAFMWCTQLKKANLPEAVTHVGRYAFSNCESLPAEGKVRYVGRYLVGTTDAYETSFKIKEGTKWIGDGAFSLSFMTSITIPESVTYIGEHAFVACENLTQIDFPKSVTHIGSLAFERCSGLTSLTIPATLKHVEENAFLSCENIKKLIYEEGRTTTMGIRLPSITTAILPQSLTSIGEKTFHDCSSLTSVTIPEGVTSIGDFAFDGCVSLQNITIPSKVTTIGRYAFLGCESFTAITIPDRVTTIGESAFAACSNLASINIPQSVTYIGKEVFSGCNSLPVEDGLRYADTYLVKATDIFSKSATIREGTKWIGSNAFYACTDLEKVILPSTLEHICYYAFAWCYHLNTAFAGNSIYYGIQLPSGLKTIEDGAFGWCDAIRTLRIPKTVTSLGEGAFGWCTELSKVYVEWETPIDVSNVNGVFDYRTRETADLMVPNGTKANYASAYEWKDFPCIMEYLCTDIKDVKNSHASTTRKYLENGRMVIKNAGHRYTLDGSLEQ